MTSPTAPRNGDDFVNGLELARQFYTEVVGPLLATRQHSAARLGPGSEVLGFDTPRSTDHDWGPEVQIFVAPAEVDATRAAIDAALPDTFRGWPVRFAGDRTGAPNQVRVAALGSWLKGQLGFNPQAGLTAQHWLTAPQQLLLEVTQGAVFFDPAGELARLRHDLAWYPDDSWRWLLACQWQRLAQEEAFVGRTAEVGDDLGSRILAARIARDLMRLAFLLERRYAPYSKWLGSAFAQLSLAAELAPHLDAALTAANYPDRETALCAAYECLAQRFNELDLAPSVDPTVRLFHERPFRVLGADRFVEACLAGIEDEWLQRQPLLGSIDQFADSTDVLSKADRAPKFTQIYDA